jgi:hypothetical protein
VALAPWLVTLRKNEITQVVNGDARTVDEDLLGVHKRIVFNEVIGGGQADFDKPWKHLTPDERALLYAYQNQKNHIEELSQAFRMMFENSAPEDPIVVDLGCGPFTGGLALANALGSPSPFSYIGVDHSLTMRRLGEKLAAAAEGLGGISSKQRYWVGELKSLSWPAPPGWRPVLVIVSYLLASPTLNASALIQELELLLTRLGRGPVTVLYTNSPRPEANLSYPAFQDALTAAGFSMIADDVGRIDLDRRDDRRRRDLKYALFQRQIQQTLSLGGD